MLISSSIDSRRLREFRAWIEAEWGNVDPFEGTAYGVSLPSPILATIDDRLAGGLAFTHALIPGKENLGLWINALIVAPQFRRKGVGSKLVEEAERVSDKAGVGVLYVHTSVPRLYQKRGWQVCQEAGESHVLTKRFSYD